MLIMFFIHAAGFLTVYPYDVSNSKLCDDEDIYFLLFNVLGNVCSVFLFLISLMPVSSLFLLSFSKVMSNHIKVCQ